MIQAIGVDGFRVDAARHMPSWVMNYLDNAVFRTSLRTNLDGSIQPIYMFSEVADGNGEQRAAVHPPRLAEQARHQPERHDGARQSRRARLPAVLEDGRQSLRQRHAEQLAQHPQREHGRERRSACSNGSQGVTFVDSHDEHSGLRPHLYKVAYAYTLMMPGNAIVY